ncbi:ATPase WRNIP1 [Neolecta irregularis DAH-3]|uniref:ATPase WRNIP1 n=1 Tax=Neolecta irregularis (strain DAH-3) TaxID=1198029 RepID=A0A1U7LUK7_NEOID|nr:ATPase WRNIP1 [Neolecta irregularis DAH-3]|eukprot:OLL26263.1 ATPase WRNIP1 [Neolecta irregularis DAH-3]
MSSVVCPVCENFVPQSSINRHLDNNCKDAFISGEESSHHSSQESNQKTSEFFLPVSSKKRLAQPVRNLQSTSTPLHEIQGNYESAVKKFKSIDALEEAKPLPEKIRPSRLDQYFGQEELVGPQGILRHLIESDQCPSMILWGPSGCGKTTLARIVAQNTSAQFKELSATTHGVNDCKKAFEDAKNLLQLTGKRTVIFMDEIHRFNKAQQDVFLPYVERGIITLIGATTENPSFKVNNALISRCRVFFLKKLSTSNIILILDRALSIYFPNSERPSGLDEAMIQHIAEFADGDGRIGLTLLETGLSALSNPNNRITPNELKNALKRTHFVYDRAGDMHYDTISAFHKSVRGSDANAALYYLARMLESGDALFVARRMVVIASEDADNNALPLAVAAHTAVTQIGMPEAEIILAHCAVYLAEAPKSTRTYMAYRRAQSALRNEPDAASAPIPMHLRNAPTKLMKSLGYSEGYKYNPDYLNGKVKQEYLPTELRTRKFLDVSGDLLIDTVLDEHTLN